MADTTNINDLPGPNNQQTNQVVQPMQNIQPNMNNQQKE